MRTSCLKIIIASETRNQCCLKYCNFLFSFKPHFKIVKYKLLIRSPQEINLVKKKIYENILPKLYKPQAKKKGLFEKNNSIMIISPEQKDDLSTYSMNLQ